AFVFSLIVIPDIEVTVDIINALFFSRWRRHTSSRRDWSSDVCSSDLAQVERAPGHGVDLPADRHRQHLEAETRAQARAPELHEGALAAQRVVGYGQAVHADGESNAAHSVNPGRACRPARLQQRSEEHTSELQSRFDL